MNLRDLFGVGTKLKKKMFKNNKQIGSTVTTRIWVLSTEWTSTCKSMGIQMKQWWWFPFVWTVDVFIQGALVLYRINKDKDNESLLLLAFRRHVVNVIFLKYSEQGRLFSNNLGTRNIPSDVCYDDTKLHQVQSEHRRIQNPVKHPSNMKCFCVNS